MTTVPEVAGALVYGTAWKEDATRDLVKAAVSAGFRAIDTANQRKHYHEAGVGAALAELFAARTCSRDDLFLQTKYTFLPGQDHRLPYDPRAPIALQVRQSLDSSLVHLGVERVDSFVLHGPSSRFGLKAADAEAWRAMEEIHAAGLATHLGVSNVDAEQLRQICALAKVKPAFVQNRCHAETGWDRDVRDACSEHGIRYQGFSLLTANRHVLADERVLAAARRLGATPAQAVFAFALAVGMLPLTGTTDPEHMRQDLDSVRLRLEPSEVAAIEGVGGR